MLFGLYGDRLVASDLIRSLFSGLQKAPVTRPERAPEVPEPVTPLERLEAGLKAMGRQLIDYRDLKQWPRDKVYDWREYGYPGDKSRAMPHGTRTWNQLTGVMLHTYGVRGVGYKRFLGTPCHLGVDTDANVVLCHDLWRYVYHGDGANRFTAGIEISGYSGFDCPEQAESAYLAARYVFEERMRNADPKGPFMNGPLVVMGHRMAKAGKSLCPGKQIWQAVGERIISEGLAVLGPVLKGGASIDAWRL